MPAGPESLEQSALNAQLQARRREAQLTDLFLVTGALSCPTDVSNTVYAQQSRAGPGYSEVDIRGRFSALRGAFCFGSLKDIAASEAIHCLIFRSPARHFAWECPLIDHLFVRAEAEPGWQELLPLIKRLRQQRSPSLREPQYFQFAEVVLGETSNDEIRNIVRKVQGWKESLTEHYGFCHCASRPKILQNNSKPDPEKAEKNWRPYSRCFWPQATYDRPKKNIS
jgi:hypothetical protein